MSTRAFPAPVRSYRTTGGWGDFFALLSAASFACLLNQGVTYYVARYLFSAEIRSPVPFLFFGALTLCLSSIFRPLSKEFLKAFVILLVISVLLSCTSYYSPSQSYKWSKFGLALVIPPLCFLGGYIFMVSGRLIVLTGSCTLLGIFAAGAYVLNGHTSLMLQAVTPEGTALLGINYQDFSNVMTLGVLWCCCRMATSKWFGCIGSLLLLLTLISFQLMAGGRGGVAMSITICLTFSARVVRSPAMRAGGALALLVVSLGLYHVLKEYAFQIIASEWTPEAIKRSVYYSFVAEAGPAAVTVRDYYYEAAWDMFLDNPGTGVGWGGFPLVAIDVDSAGDYPHNLVLELLAETGVWGAGSFSLLFLLVVCRLSGVSSDPLLKLSAASMLISGVVVSMVSGDYPAQRLLFVGMGSVFGLDVLDRDPEILTLKPKNRPDPHPVLIGRAA
jgi:O-antigen ligase